MAKFITIKTADNREIAVNADHISAIVPINDGKCSRIVLSNNLTEDIKQPVDEVRKLIDPDYASTSENEQWLRNAKLIEMAEYMAERRAPGT